MSEVFRSIIPWDEWLSLSENLEYASHEARLTHVTTRDVVVSVSPADYLAMKGTTVEGTLLRRMLTAERWAQFGSGPQRSHGAPMSAARASSASENGSVLSPTICPVS